jgi:hypothetical protein
VPAATAQWCGKQRGRAAGQQSTTPKDRCAVAAPGGAELSGPAAGVGQGLGAHRAAAGPGDRRQALKQLPDTLSLFGRAEVPGVGLAPASGEQFGEHAAQLGEVAAAGAQQGEEVVDGPGGEDPGAGQVEADGVDPVPVGGIEEQVAGQLPRRALRHLRQWAAGALEVEQQAVDDDVGVGRDLGAGERRPADAVLGSGAGAQSFQGAVGGLVELGGDVAGVPAVA